MSAVVCARFRAPTRAGAGLDAPALRVESRAVPGILHIDTDPGLLTNRRMSLEIGVGLAVLTGRRLSMPWADRIGNAPGPAPARHRGQGTAHQADPRPRMLDLWEVPVATVTDEEWVDAADDAPAALDWGIYTKCVYLADPQKVPHPGVIEFANGRTRFVRVPPSDDHALRILGRPLSWYSYFFHATGDTRRRLVDAIGRVRLQEPYTEFAASVVAGLGTYNVAHVRRTDLVRGIRAYAGVSPHQIARTLAEVLPTDETLVLATEAEPTSTLFDPIRATFRDVVFLDDVILGDHAAGFDALPFHEDNALGAVTQLVATSAERFVGTMGSTFTGLIQRERCRRDPAAPFRYTADYTPKGPVFREGRYVETHEGRYTWNRVGLKSSPDVLAWLREWPEAVVSPDDSVREPDRKDPRDEPIHAVVCTDTNPYGDWQCRFQEHTWLRAGQPGELVRLVGCPNGETPPRHERARVVKTAGANSHPRASASHPGFNRLWSLQEWLATEHPEGLVLILDSDFVFRGPVRTTVEQGTVVGQEWFDAARGSALADRLAPFVDVDLSRLQPVTWPALIDARDLAAILPRWLDLTADLRPFAWENDMFAFVGALAESGLDVRYETLGAWMNWPEEFVAGAPIIHYCQPVVGKDGARLWFKQGYKPWDPIGVDPNDAALDYCRDLLHLLDEFTGLQADLR